MFRKLEKSRQNCVRRLVPAGTTWYREQYFCTGTKKWPKSEQYGGGGNSETLKIWKIPKSRNSKNDHFSGKKKKTEFFTIKSNLVFYILKS